jgi:hypothetical protein
MLIALTSLAFEIAAQRARCLILKTEHELSVVGDASAQIGVAYFLIGRWEPSSDLSFFTTSRSTPHPLRVLAGLSPRQGKLTIYINPPATIMGSEGGFIYLFNYCL